MNLQSMKAVSMQSNSLSLGQNLTTSWVTSVATGSRIDPADGAAVIATFSHVHPGAEGQISATTRYSFQWPSQLSSRLLQYLTIP